MISNYPPMMGVSSAALDWLNRAGQDIGTERVFEDLERAQFYVDRTAFYAQTPAEKAIVRGLEQILIGVIDADRDARETLKDSIGGMSLADATEFVEMCEAAEEN